MTVTNPASATCDAAAGRNRRTTRYNPAAESPISVICATHHIRAIPTAFMVYLHT